MKKVILGSLLIFFASCDLVFVENISDKSVEIIAPADNAELTTAEIIFFWEALEDADEYKLQIITPSFTNATAIIIDTTLTTTSFKTELAAEDYQWRIKAMNDEYETEYKTYSFDLIFVEDISDKSVEIIAPADNAELTAAEINFFWEALEDADEYKLQIITPSFTNATGVIIDTTLTTTSFKTELAAEDYQWRIKAMNDEYETEYKIHTLIINE